MTAYFGILGGWVKFKEGVFVVVFCAAGAVGSIGFGQIAKLKGCTRNWHLPVARISVK